MHHIYTTEGFIIKSFSVGEANKGYFLFTKNLGLVRASAQGVRLSKSKLKGHLGDFDFIEVSLVKGKEIWRITNVSAIIQNPFRKDKEKLSAVKNIFGLMLRLIHGEEKNEPLFSVNESFYRFLLSSGISAENIKNLEAVMALRILFNLGYLKKDEGLSEFAEGSRLSAELLDSFSTKRKTAIKEINEILKETHL